MLSPENKKQTKELKSTPMKPMAMKPTAMKPTAINTAEAFYVLFRALHKKDRLAVARYILEDEDISGNFGFSEIPNEITLNAFAEEKSTMPVFHSIEELRKDLMS